MLRGEPEYRRRIREKAEKDQHASEAAKREAKNEGYLGNITVVIQRVEQELQRVEQEIRTSNDEHTPQKNRDRCWERFGFLGLWFAGIVGIAAIFFGTRDAGEQRKVMQDQLAAMQSAMQQTERTISALNTQAAVMNGQLSEMQDARSIEKSRLQARLKMTTGINHADSQWSFTPRWTNVGATDALDLWLWDKMQIFRPNIPNDFLCPVGPRPKGATVGSVGPTDDRFQLSTYLSDEEVAKVASGEGTILFWGYRI
jgi:hypothetical protein